jgi:hypothetical protein
MGYCLALYRHTVLELWRRMHQLPTSQLVRVKFVTNPKVIRAERSIESVITDFPTFEDEEKKPVDELRITVCNLAHQLLRGLRLRSLQVHVRINDRF